MSRLVDSASGYRLSRIGLTVSVKVQAKNVPPTGIRTIPNNFSAWSVPPHRAYRKPPLTAEDDPSNWILHAQMGLDGKIYLFAFRGNCERACSPAKIPGFGIITTVTGRYSDNMIANKGGEEFSKRYV